MAEDPMRISTLPAELAKEESAKKLAEREEFQGMRVPKGTAAEQKAYKDVVAARAFDASIEPVEGIMKRYGLEDPYMAGLYKRYQSAPSTAMKDSYAKMIRAEVDPTLMDRAVSGNPEVRRMGKAVMDQMGELEDAARKVVVADKD
jgi:hypothetical protein